MNTFLIIPSFNEGDRLLNTLSVSRNFISDDHIVVVDDGSKKAPLIPKKIKCWYLRHKINLGKGAAMRTGADFAFSKGADAIIYIDADGQHDPSEIPEFSRFLDKGYDLVFGSRRFIGDAPLTRYLGKKFTSVYVNLVFGIYVSDILSGFRALSKKAYKLIAWQSNRYNVEAEMVVRLSRHKKELKWIEIPIRTIYIFKYKGMTVLDGIKLLINSIGWRIF